MYSDARWGRVVACAMLESSVHRTASLRSRTSRRVESDYKFSLCSPLSWSLLRQTWLRSAVNVSIFVNDGDMSTCARSYGCAVCVRHSFAALSMCRPMVGVSVVFYSRVGAAPGRASERGRFVLLRGALFAFSLPIQLNSSSGGR